MTNAAVGLISAKKDGADSDGSTTADEYQCIMEAKKAEEEVEKFWGGVQYGDRVEKTR